MKHRRTIYNDDPDAIEQLRAKLAELEAKRARIKAINSAIRRHGYAALREEASLAFLGNWKLLTPPLRAVEADALEELARRPALGGFRGYPPYTASNLTNLICQTRKRIAKLADREPPEPDGEAFRGGEAAAYAREQMIEAQRLK